MRRPSRETYTQGWLNQSPSMPLPTAEKARAVPTLASRPFRLRCRVSVQPRPGACGAACQKSVRIARPMPSLCLFK